MDQALKAKWVEALRSGEYKQGSGVLFDTYAGSYCCLGVLCKVMGAEFGDAVEKDDEEWKSHDFVPHIGDRVLGEDEELKPAVCKELGIPDQFALIKLNDGFGEEPDQLGFVRQRSFAEIADYIEANL